MDELYSIYLQHTYYPQLHVTYSIDDSQEQDAERSKQVTEEHVLRFHLYESKRDKTKSYIVYRYIEVW